MSFKHTKYLHQNNNVEKHQSYLWSSKI